MHGKTGKKVGVQKQRSFLLVVGGKWVMLKEVWEKDLVRLLVF